MLPQFAAIFEHEPYVYCSRNHRLMEQLTLYAINTRWQPGESSLAGVIMHVHLQQCDIVLLINVSDLCFDLD